MKSGSSGVTKKTCPRQKRRTFTLGREIGSIVVCVSSLFLLLQFIYLKGIDVPLQIDIYPHEDSDKDVKEASGLDFFSSEEPERSKNSGQPTKIVTKCRTEIITVPVIIPFRFEEQDNNKRHSDHDAYKAKNTDNMSGVRRLDLAELCTNCDDGEKSDREERPLLLTGWIDYSAESGNRMMQERLSAQTERDNFVKLFGNYTMYVKADDIAEPLKDKEGEKCIAPVSSKVKLMEASQPQKKLHLFTNDLESPSFMAKLKTEYNIPEPINYGKDGLNIFSAMVQGSYFRFHSHDDETQMYQVHGRRIVWFLPPNMKNPSKENPCKFLTGEAALDPDLHVTMAVQQTGETILIPGGWWYATCALDDWNVAVGMQRINNIEKIKKNVHNLPQPYLMEGEKEKDNENKGMLKKNYTMPWKDPLGFQIQMMDCGVHYNWNNLNSWVWFDGDVNKYYNKLIASDSKRDPNNINTYAVHRWLGKERSTLVHYELILSAMNQFTSGQGLRVLDAGCGLGAGLMWFEKNAPSSFQMVGHTLSSAQLDFINKLPEHKFRAVLKSFDDLDEYKGDNPIDAIYSIEAFIHTPDENNTLKQWSEALADKGLVVLIDDFITVGVDKDAEDIQIFKKSWMGNVLQSTTSLAELAEKHNLELVLDRDIGSEYQVNKLNYKNTMPWMYPTKERSHQAWLGVKMRMRLMLEGKLTYRLVVFQKRGGVRSRNIEKHGRENISISMANDKA